VVNFRPGTSDGGAVRPAPRPVVPPNLRLSFGAGCRVHRAAACCQVKLVAAIEHCATHRVRAWSCAVLRIAACVVNGTHRPVACVSVSRGFGRHGYTARTRRPETTNLRRSAWGGYGSPASAVWRNWKEAAWRHL
jgi:hypothetical protein